MKITAEHFEQLQQMVARLPLSECRFEKAYQRKGLSHQRYRWDVLYACEPADRTRWFREVYQYANDDHVDTALRALLGKDYPTKEVTTDEL